MMAALKKLVQSDCVVCSQHICSNIVQNFVIFNACCIYLYNISDCVAYFCNTHRIQFTMLVLVNTCISCKRYNVCLLLVIDSISYPFCLLCDLIGIPNVWFCNMTNPRTCRHNISWRAILWSHVIPGWRLYGSGQGSWGAIPEISITTLFSPVLSPLSSQDHLSSRAFRCPTPCSLQPVFLV